MKFSHKIQNELLEIMAQMVHREQVQAIRKANFFAVIADGTTDISRKEQFSICIRYDGASNMKGRLTGTPPE